jgi:AraC-like DNA-binding protein
VNLAFEGGRGTVHGIPTHRASRRLEGSGWALGTKFRPGAFRQFTAIRAPELVGRVVTVEEAFAAGDGGKLRAAINARSPDLEAMIEAVEAYLREHRTPVDPAGELLREIVAEMLVAPSGITVSEIARRHGMSTRALQRLFRSYVGVGPKWVLRRYRLQEAAERIAAGEVEDYASLALDLGYFDQAHFNRDFRAMVGRAPSEYARACAVAAQAA